MIGPYAKRLDIPAARKEKRVFIRFEAASLVADVYLNGKKIGEHRGGFTAFCFELTPYLDFHGDNILRVRVDKYGFARQAGVGESTVSRVLRNKGSVSKQTREKILKVAADLHYVPNRIAGTLA